MKRSDGTLIRTLNPFEEIVPYIMERRSDAQNFAQRVFPTDPIDAYLRDKRQQGIHLSYMHVFIAASVRVLAERPSLNRFVMDSRIYQRRGISISMAIKRSLREDGEETTVKFDFTGGETLMEIVGIIDGGIASVLADPDGEADQLIRTLMRLPHELKKNLVRLLKALDRHNLLPKSIIQISPFHTSLFFTHLKSIKSDYIFHHLYDFGTTGLFLALGKNVKLPRVEKDQVVIRSCVQVGITTDERICDGLYLSRSLQLFDHYIAHPDQLEAPPSISPADAGPVS